MHVNTFHPRTYSWSAWWSHTWMNGPAEKVPVYTDKFRAWRPTQQRPRDGTIVRHKTGGLKRVS